MIQELYHHNHMTCLTHSAKRETIRVSRVLSLVFNDLRAETKGSQFESTC